MNRKIIYLILIFLLFLGVKQYYHFGDYSMGMTQGLILVFSFIIFITIFLILFIKDVYSLLKFKKRFDFIPLILLSLFISLLVYGFVKINEPFFWKNEIYRGKINYEGSRDKIILYKDGTFAFEINQIENKDYVCGKYKVSNDTLKLINYNEKNINNIFSNSYLFVKDSNLVPFNDNYLSIIKINKGE